MEQAHDSIDTIMQKVSLILLKKQSVSFEKLRQLTLLGTSKASFEEYCEIVVLSIIKYLDLNKEFKEEIRENRSSYRLFNALNLNDDKINQFFVEFISVLAPEIFTALSAVLAQLAVRLAERNKSKYASDRMNRLQERINTIIEDNDDPELIEEDFGASQEEKQREIKPKRQARRVSFTEYLTGSNYSRQKRIKSKSSSKNDNSKSSSSQSKDLRLGVENLVISSRDSVNSETASETAERLANQRRRERKSIPDANSDVLPSKDEIRHVRFETNGADDVSSIAF